MKNANLIENSKRSSFLELSNSSQETDDYDDDDEEITTPKKNMIHENEKENLLKKNKFKLNNSNNEDFEKQEELNLLQTKMQIGLRKDTSKKNLLYNKPKENRSNLEMQRAEIFRNTQMANLQSSRTFKHSSRENINESYNKGSASLGKANADEFVSFLGYLRDASSRASQLIAKKEEKKLAKLIKGNDNDKKNGINRLAPNTDIVDNDNKISKNNDEEKKNDYVPTSSVKYSPDQ